MLAQMQMEKDRSFVDEEEAQPQQSRSATTVMNNPVEEFAPPPAPIESEEPKVGRNDPCPCGSGKKYKKCCGVTAHSS
jgi:uncharacterized protein YecA (UPF0149 family)